MTDNKEVFEILRDSDTGTIILTVNEDVSWELYAGNNPNNIDMSSMVASGRKKGKFTINIHDNRRIYFNVVTPHATIMIAERALPLSGVFNFRDLGGYMTKDGRSVKWGMLFRSGELSGLTENDMEYLAGIPLLTVVDFRGSYEVSSTPGIYPPKVRNKYSCPITTGDIMSAANKMPDREEAERLMIEANSTFISSNDIASQFKRFFKLLLKKRKAPLVFHCTAGKDRTGIVAALTLLALGVDEQTVMRDYMLSNIYIKEKYAAMAERYPNLQPLLEVKESYLNTALDKIKSDYGSIDTYITKILGINTKKLRELYLSP